MVWEESTIRGVGGVRQTLTRGEGRGSRGHVDGFMLQGIMGEKRGSCLSVGGLGIFFRDDVNPGLWQTEGGGPE